MSWRQIWYKLVGLPISLWAMASIIFVLSRLLPQSLVPVGMEDADTRVFGAASKEVVNRVKLDYQHRLGLDKPLFYFSIVSSGYKEAYQLQPSDIDLLWVQKLMKWHNREVVRAFYKEWLKYQLQSSSEQTLTEIRDFFINYSKVTDSEKRQDLSAGFSRVLSKTSQNQNLGNLNLLVAWNSIKSSKAEYKSLVPAILWYGSENQYHQWFKNIIQGDLGVSALDYRPVIESILVALQTSLSIGLLGFLVAFIISLSLGFWFTLNPYSIIVKVAKQILYLLDSIPAFVIALGTFAAFLSLGGSLSGPNFFIAHQDSNFWNVSLSSSHYMAIFCIVLFLLPHVTLHISQSLEQEKQQEYLKTAQAKGLSHKSALLYHALPNAFPTVLTLVSEVLINLVAGVLIVEISFSLSGIGSLLIQSIVSRDYNLLIGITLTLLTFRLLVSWLTDILTTFIDPRIRIA